LTLNLGTARSDGGEIDIAARVTDRFSLHLAGGYEDARLTRVSPGTEYYVGEPLSGVPKVTVSASADCEIPQAWGKYFVRTQYSYTGQSTSYTEVATGLVRNAYELTDLRLGAAYRDYTVTLFVKNLFDSRPNLSDEVPVSALAGDRYRYWVGLPREVGLDFRYNF
jgi:outer membrane receptor protein involved in Fe transport